MVGNIRCSSEKVSCGKPCGRPLGCGFHRCEQLCHGGACSGCTAICGKPRKPWCVLDLIAVPLRSNSSKSNFGPTVFQPSTPARNPVTPRPFVQRPNRALLRLRLLVPVGAFSSPSSVGAAPRVQLGARPLLYHVAPTSARSRSAMLVSQRRLASTPTCTKPTHVKLCIRMT